MVLKLMLVEPAHLAEFWYAWESLKCSLVESSMAASRDSLSAYYLRAIQILATRTTGKEADEFFMIAAEPEPETGAF